MNLQNVETAICVYSVQIVVRPHQCNRTSLYTKVNKLLVPHIGSRINCKTLHKQKLYGQTKDKAATDCCTS